MWAAGITAKKQTKWHTYVEIFVWYEFQLVFIDSIGFESEKKS